MACFLVPTAEAVVVTAAAAVVRHHEKKKIAAVESGSTAPVLEEKTGIPWSRKLKWLAGLLWGGALLLAYEHVWHGEVVPWFPFLAAMSDPADTAEMVHEMLTAGVTMAAIVTAAWAVVCAAADAIFRRRDKRAEEAA